ncbi:hypothetical protein [Lentilitoribacter sp. EG35]|uniref:hypothetical protein n=1 Tax=Lentilitoribacter sp. EG35 TaxID=3234192 RepID=UPI003460D72F
MKYRIFLTAALLAGLTSFSSMFAHAQNPIDEEYATPIRTYITNNVKPWLSDPIIINSINRQNRQTSQLSEAEIIAQDEKWHAEVQSENRPFIDKILNNDLSKFLTQKQNESDEFLLEIFVMDAKGLNVGQSAVTSDYWQGDEAKWLNTFPKGPNTIFIEDIKIDESTLTFQSQASLSIADPKTGKTIGAITLGINFEKL